MSLSMLSHKVSYRYELVALLFIYFSSSLQARQEPIVNKDDYYLGGYCISGFATFNKKGLMTKKTYYQCDFTRYQGFRSKEFVITIDEYGQEAKYTYLHLKFSPYTLEKMLYAEKFVDGIYFNVEYPENFKVAKRQCKDSYYVSAYERSIGIKCESFDKKGKKVQNPYDAKNDATYIPLKEAEKKELARKKEQEEKEKKLKEQKRAELLKAAEEKWDGSPVVIQNNLIWQRCSVGQFPNGVCSGSPESLHQDVAIKYCNELELDGYSDWRVPDYYELKDLVICSNNRPIPQKTNVSCASSMDQTFLVPTIDQVVFPNTASSVYWTDTINGEKFTHNFRDGSLFYIDSYNLRDEDEYQIRLKDSTSMYVTGEEKAYLRCVHDR